MAKGYHHLTYELRCQLYTLIKRGDSPALIANELGVDRSTIYRELSRNKGGRGYRFKQAQQLSSERRRAVSSRPRKMTPSTISVIIEKLNLKWSPEQISGWLHKVEHPHASSHETIYQYIWEDKKNGGSLYKNLRHHGKKYNKRSSGTAGRGCIPNRVDIDERPKIVEKKNRIGDWELDTIIGKGHKGAIVSIVDRASKLTKLIKVPNKTAEAVQEAILKKLLPIQDWVLTLTADNGKEFANHEQIAAILQGEFYFAKPYHSWERGLNEHTNGLVRQYCPKTMSFENLTQSQLDEIEIELNDRPRKVLGYNTPKEIFGQRKLETPIDLAHS